MKRPIKFRGRVPEGYHHYGGQFVYGSLVIYPENAPWAQGYPHWIVPLDDRRAYPVDEDSIAQFVGFDADGAEVYEGDELVNAANETFNAILLDGIYTDEGFIHTVPLECCKLKEATT